MKREKVMVTSLAALVGTSSVAGVVTDVKAEVKLDKASPNGIYTEQTSRKASTFEEAASNLAHTKTQYDTAKTNMELAKQEADEAKSAFDDVIKKEAALKTEVARKTDDTKIAFNQTVIVSAENVITAQDNLDQAKKEKEDAEKTASSKSEAYDKALEEWERANASYDSLKESYGDISSEDVDNAEAAYETAKNNKIEAEEEVDNLKDELVVVENDKIAAEQAWTDAKTDLESVTEKKNEAENNASMAETAYLEAKAELDNLGGEVDTSSPEYQEKYNAVVSAKAEWERLTGLKNTAEAEYQEAKKLSDQAESDYLKIEERFMELSNDLDEAEGTLLETSEAETTTKDAYDEAKLIYDKALENAAPELKKLEQAEAEAAVAKEALAKAKTEKEQADQNVLNAEKAVKDAEEALENAESTFADATKQGSLGFFEYVGNSFAVSQIKNCKYASYTTVGSSKDATSLKNMLKSLNYIRQCNQIRSEHGLPELKVTDVLMAQAQANANASDDLMTHTMQFNVAENLAWSYDAPFEAWYDHEKKLYDAGERDFSVVGHYLNIINPNYTVTGYALCYTNIDNDGFDQTNSQVFHKYSVYGQSYTVDEYEARLNEYIKSITSNPSQTLEEAKKRLATALSERDAAEKEYEKAKTASTLADQSYETAKENYQPIAENIKKAKGTLDKAESSLTLAREGKQKAQDVFDEKTILFEQCEVDFQEKVDSRDETFIFAQTKKENLDRLTNEAKKAKSDLENAEIALKEYGNSFSDEYKAALEKFKSAKSELEAKNVILESAVLQYNEMKDKLSSAAFEKKRAIENFENLTNLISEKEKELPLLNGKVETTEKTYEDLKLKVSELEKAESNASNCKENLETADTEQKHGFKVVEEKEQLVKESEEALEKAEILKKQAESLNFETAYKNGTIGNDSFPSLGEKLTDLLKTESDLLCTQNYILELTKEKDSLRSAYEKAYQHYVSCLSAYELAKKDYNELKPEPIPQPTPEPKPHSNKSPNKPVHTTVKKDKSGTIENITSLKEDTTESGNLELEIPLNEETVATVTLPATPANHKKETPHTANDISSESEDLSNGKEDRATANPIIVLLGVLSGGAAGVGLYHFRKRK